MRRLILVAVIAVAINGQAAAQSARPDLDLAYRQRTEERLSQLESQIRSLTGQIERLDFRLRQADQKVAELEAALAEAREAAAQPSDLATSGDDPAAPPQTVDPADATRAGGSLPSGPPQEQYDAAFGLLRAGKFDAGEKAFRDFLAAYPDHQLAGNARYWIGEALYARNRDTEAATAFLEAWQAEPQGRKAPDNLLKLGMSLQRLDKVEEACLTYAKLLSEYRGAERRLLTVARQERKSLNCA